MTELEAAATEIEITFDSAMKRRNFKQKDIAKMIGTTPSQVSRAFKGSMTPKDKLIRKEAAKILGITL